MPRSSRPKTRRKSSPVTVEHLERVLEALVAERQQLRDRGAGRAELEANRLAIVRLQWKLSRALIDRYLPRRPDRAAA